MASSSKSVYFIGGGNMAFAIIGGLNRSTWKVVVAEVYEPQRLKLEKELRVQTVATAADPQIKSSNVVVLAVKPQSITQVLEELKGVDFSGKIVVSIMAGVPLKVLADGLTGKGVRLVRAMPNTPLLVGKGVTGLYVTDDSVKKDIEDLLGGTSQLFYVKEEDDLNKVTGISGSGPAYYYAFIEALTKAGIEMGLDPDTAAKMSIGTALGAATLAATSKEDVPTLRKNVTSKGGTTEQALLSFQKSNLDKVVRDAAFAAYLKGQELGDAFKRSKL